MDCEVGRKPSFRDPRVAAMFLIIWAKFLERSASCQSGLLHGTVWVAMTTGSFQNPTDFPDLNYTSFGFDSIPVLGSELNRGIKVIVLWHAYVPRLKSVVRFCVLFLVGVWQSQELNILILMIWTQKKQTEAMSLLNNSKEGHIIKIEILSSAHSQLTLALWCLRKSPLPGE